MGIEANTYEQMHIMNRNEQTKTVALAVSNYLKTTWGITQLILTVDGKSYRDDAETLDENPEILAVCDKLPEAEEITFILQSTNNGGLCWRRESSFLKELVDVPEMTNYIEYKSVDYYDQDSAVDLYRFDSRGGSDLSDQYETDLAGIKNIERWYSYSPEIVVSTQETQNEELHQKVCSAFAQLMEMTESDEDALEDDWEDGEMIWESALSFSTSQLEEIIKTLKRLADLIDGTDTKMNMSIGAVPDGEKDYNFAALLIHKDDKEFKTEYCIF